MCDPMTETQLSSTQLVSSRLVSYRPVQTNGRLESRRLVLADIVSQFSFSAGSAILSVQISTGPSDNNNNNSLES